MGGAVEVQERPSIDERIRQVIEKGTSTPRQPLAPSPQQRPSPLRKGAWLGVFAGVASLSLAALAIRLVLEQRTQEQPADPGPIPSHTFDPPAESSPGRALPPAAPEAPAERSGSLKVFPTVGGSLPSPISSIAPARPPRPVSQRPVSGGPLAPQALPARPPLMAPPPLIPQQPAEGSQQARSGATDLRGGKPAAAVPPAPDAETLIQDPPARVVCNRGRITRVATSGVSLNRDN